ncbi:uncharacterized protein LOC117225673 isoform X1 [Megalopta genalis]|uniref:uncharacterized protein LOC117225673 isoform X1 n=1 Tax=Megalopta genalis TaxID=115081 RepID=UPI003FCFD85E
MKLGPLFRPSNVYEESWYLFFYMKLLGLYPIRFHRSPYLNHICGIIILLPYYCLFSNVFHYATRKMNLMMIITPATKIRQLRFYTNVVMLFVVVISTSRRCDKTRKAFENLNSVDENMKFLNVYIDYNRCMRTDIVQITTVAFVTILFNLMDYYGLSDNDRNYMYVLMWIADRTPDFVNTIVLCSFAVLTRKIQFRFRKINELLDSINGGKNFISVIGSDVNNDFRLILSKVLLLKLWKTVSLVNMVYGISLKVLTALYILYLCLHICVVYNCSDYNRYLVDTFLSVLWGSLDIAKLVYIIHLYRILLIQVA